MALQMLYQHELGGAEAHEVRASFDPVEALRTGGAGAEIHPDVARQAFAFARRLFEGTLERQEEIDRLVKSQAENWRLERMPAVDRNILRLAVFELLAGDDVPPLVVLDEAIELAKRYGSEQSGAFVNGLLDGLLRRRESSDSEPPTEDARRAN
jgi:transcription antitermination protein NusB